MQNFILFVAQTEDEVNAAAYSMIKYLGSCNLKPPADQTLVVFTRNPAALEAYSAFFNQFQFHQPQQDSKSETLKYFCNSRKGNMIYFGPNAYPARPLQPVFESIAKGTIYSDITRNRQGQGAQKDINVLGLNTAIHPFDLHVLENGQAVHGFAEQYMDVKEFHLLLRKFFKSYSEESVPGQIKLASAIDIGRIREQKNQYEKLPFFTKMTRRVTGKAWNIADYIKS